MMSNMESLRQGILGELARLAPEGSRYSVIIDTAHYGCVIVDLNLPGVPAIELAAPRLLERLRDKRATWAWLEELAVYQGLCRVLRRLSPEALPPVLTVQGKVWQLDLRDGKTPVCGIDPYKLLLWLEAGEVTWQVLKDFCQLKAGKKALVQSQLALDVPQPKRSHYEH